MSLEFACFNADWTRRKSVNTQMALAATLAEYAGSFMEHPTAFTLAEVNKGTAAATIELLGDGYEHISEKLTYDTLSLVYDTDMLEMRGSYEVSRHYKYIAAAFESRHNAETIVIANVHLPFKKPCGFVGRGTILDQAHAHLASCVSELYGDHDADRIVIMGDFNTQPDALAEYHPDYEMLLGVGDTSTENATCPDNVLMWTADGDSVFAETQIFDGCAEFEHHPIWTRVD
jgi:hypothetical protein